MIDDLQTSIKFEKHSDTLVTQAKHKNLVPTIKWADWEPTFVNPLKLIPGRTGIPSSYAIKHVAKPPPGTFVGLVLENYTYNAPLVGPAYKYDTQ